MNIYYSVTLVVEMHVYMWSNFKEEGHVSYNIFDLNTYHYHNY